jgi:hypothetical protein
MNVVFNAIKSFLALALKMLIGGAELLVLGVSRTMKAIALFVVNVIKKISLMTRALLVGLLDLISFSVKGLLSILVTVWGALIRLGKALKNYFVTFVVMLITGLVWVYKALLRLVFGAAKILVQVVVWSWQTFIRSIVWTAKTIVRVLIWTWHALVRSIVWTAKTIVRALIWTWHALVRSVVWTAKMLVRVLIWTWHALIRSIVWTAKMLVQAAIWSWKAFIYSVVRVWKALVWSLFFVVRDIPIFIYKCFIYLSGAVKSMIEKLTKAFGLRRRHGLFTKYWLQCLGPIIAIVVLGAILFKDAVVESIESTPHPSLVYTIFGTLLLGVGYCSFVLIGLIKEEGILINWQKLTTMAERKKTITQIPEHSAFMPVLNLMAGELSLSTMMRQSAVESELDSIERVLVDRLNFPNYLAGALVGIGLIGTFVGLLGTLADLGKLFESLGGSANANADAAALFGDMVQKLQAPMKGMGTAFVASLYGLLGSLMLGLMVMSIKSVAVGVVERMRTSIHHEGYGAEAEDQSSAQHANKMILQEFKESRAELAALNKNVEMLLKNMIENNQNNNQNNSQN